MKQQLTTLQPNFRRAVRGGEAEEVEVEEVAAEEEWQSATNPTTSLQPVPRAQMYEHGKTPADFHGTSKGEDFLEECKGYLLLNEEYQASIPQEENLICLTHMKDQMWPDGSKNADPIDNIDWQTTSYPMGPILVEFERTSKTQQKLTKHEPPYKTSNEGNDVDAYITGFEQLARRAATPWVALKQNNCSYKGYPARSSKM